MVTFVHLPTATIDLPLRLTHVALDESARAKNLKQLPTASFFKGSIERMIRLRKEREQNPNLQIYCQVWDPKALDQRKLITKHTVSNSQKLGTNKTIL